MHAKIVQVHEASKKFSRSLRQVMIYAPLDIGRSILGLDRHSDRLRKGEFWAVDEVSFDLEQGARIGLIGRNGSGKSTLLKMLNGILLPDKGSIRIKGRVGALIEVGAGFHPLLTGRENIFANGAILGMKQSGIRRKFNEIVAFADIGDFVDSPVKFYSSGMYVRLGFSVAIHSEPEILLIDEVLAVGDFAFQKKCFDRIDSMVAQGITIVFVSHSMAAVQRLCPKALVMDRGRILFIGDSIDASAKYYQSMSRLNDQSDFVPNNGPKIIHRGVGSMVVYLSAFKILNDQMQSVSRIPSGAHLCFALEVRSKDRMAERLPRIAIRIVDPQTGELLVNIQTPQSLYHQAEVKGELTLECEIPSFNLAPGIYQLEAKIGGDGEDLHDYAVIKEPFEVNWAKDIVENMSYKGKIYMPGRWKMGNESD